MKYYSNNSKRGSGYLIVLAFAAILLIFFAMFARVRSGHHQLQSKDVRRFIASNLGEAALNCIVAELNANRAFNTHLHYYPYSGNKLGWYKPIKRRDSLIGKMDNLTLNGVNNGIYSGYTEHGEFKARFAQNYGSRENIKTKALRESEMYTRVEIVVKVGGGWGIKEQTYRKISAILERRYPATEYLLFDGEMLDLGGLGPFPGRENQLKRSRLYGYNWITFNTAGGACKGNEIIEGEKIETPGLIRALVDTDIEFSNKERHKLTKENDSMFVSKFEDFDGYIVDGPHGAHPIKFTRLPRERIKKSVESYKKTYGITITDKTLPASSYSNPYDPGTKYYDLNFGEYRAVAVPKDDDEKSVRSTRADDDDDDDEENSVPGDAEEEVDDIDTKDSDDPEIIKEKHGRKLLVYSEVPLRIWGCPDKSITIYSTKDIVIAGDFNQNPETSQVYKDKNYLEYKKVLRNGKNNNKVGAMIMSEGRIFIDVSSPSKFAKNEVKPYFFYCLGMSMHPSSVEIEEELKRTVCPPEPRDRGTILGVNSSMGSGIAEARFGTMAYLYNYPDVNSGGSYEANIEDLKNFFMPGGTALDPRFGIKDPRVRDGIIEYIKQAIRRGSGDLTKEEQDNIFNMAWEQALIEEEKDYDPGCGASGLMSGLFNEAVKKESDGIFIPEITINATLISSCRRASNWHIGNSNVKVKEEIGNPEEYLKKPGFIIQRIYGGEIRIGRAKPNYFVDGSHSGGNILRRRIWDNTNLTNRDFKPLEAPAVHNILTFTDEQISEKEYNNFKG
ncbi:MAG: hypothetical protein II961_04135 [Candidatus Riflebacteria bacterium]|nr:hypothetical protein [Candidatus Riflebacteria bacterium]